MKYLMVLTTSRLKRLSLTATTPLTRPSCGIVIFLATILLPQTRADALSAIPGIAQHNYLLAASVFQDKILRFDAETGAYVDDFVSPNSGGLDEPSGMAVGPDGNLYVASAQNSRILRYDGTSGAFIDTFATNAQLPIGLSFGPGGDLYVASRDALSVLRFDGQTGASKGVFATTNAPLPGSSGLSVNWWPWDLAFRPDGNLYLSSFERQLVLQFDSITGQYEGIFANGRSSTALGRAAGLTFGPDNNLYLAGYFGDVVRFDGSSGALLGTFANLSDDATDIEFGPGGDLYVALRNRGAIVRVNGVTGDVLGDFTSGGQWTSSHFLLFTHPVPEPGTVMMLMSGLISWMLGARSIRQFPRR